MRQIRLAIPSDRITGFTIPRCGAFHVCDHDEVFRVSIAEPPLVEVTEDDPYAFVEQSRDFVGLHFQGCPLNAPLMQAGESSIAYDFNPKRDFVTVTYTIGGRSGEIRFRTMSGDWFCASLSDDGAHLVLSDPYELALYEL